MLVDRTEAIARVDLDPPVSRARTAAAARPVLIVLHQEHSTHGHIGNELKGLGLELDVRRPRFGESLPTTLAHHAGAIVFGGPMSANDTDDYLRRELNLIDVALKEERPYLGVCLGGQMLALLLGAKVSADAGGYVEIGYHAIDGGEVADLGGAWPDTVYQWHREGFELASGCELLARAESPFPNQAFRYGPAAIGLQFHPEITYAMIARWTGRNEQRLELPGAQARADQLAAHIEHGATVRRWLRRLLADWLASGKSI